MASVLTHLGFTPLLVYGLVAPVAITFAVLISTYTFTNLRYKVGKWRLQQGKGKATTPVKIPYTIPILGNAIEFLNTSPGSFWTYLLKWHPRVTGACTLKMGGNSMHVLFDEHAIQALFKAREPARHATNFHIGATALGAGVPQARLYYGHDEPAQEAFDGRTPVAEQEYIWTSYLLRADRVNELTAKFMEVLQNQVSTELLDDKTSEATGLYAWLRTRMFGASTTALFGSSFLEDYPELEQDYFPFDIDMLKIYFGIPRWMAPEIYNVRDRLRRGMIRWHERNLERNKGQVAHPDSIAWEPIQGSRVNRARQLYYEKRGLATRTRALFDLGLLFGISSNAIPAAGWTLMHILDPNADKSLLPRVMQAINASKRADGSFDVFALISQPLLQSIMHETFRLYVDNLVTREIPKDLIVPVGAAGDKLLLRKDTLVIAPSWLEHRNNALWSNPSADTFYAERFLTTDPVTGKDVFSTGQGMGRLFPFGGGKTICPGRAFAKQEVLGCVAMMLSEFEFDVTGFLDEKGRKTDAFPKLGRAYPGGAVLPIGGDVEVRIKRRRS